MRIWLVHGILTRRGDGAIDALIPFLEKDGHEVLQFDYGWTFLVGAKLWNKRRAKALAKLIQPGDIAIGHSNGCTILHWLTNLLPTVPLRQVIYLAPALDSDLVPLWLQVKSLVVYYSPSDKAVQKASWIPGVIWGNMGAVGCSVVSRFVKNFNKDKLLDAVVEHSGFLKPLHCRKFYNHLREQFK